MITNQFRPALSVELFDAGLIIRLPDCEGSGLSDQILNGLQISRADLDRFERMLGIEPQPLHEPRTLGEILTRNADITIRRETTSWNECYRHYKLIEIQARVDAPQLLSLRIVGRFHGDTQRDTANLTYSGAFSIEWEDEEAPGATE